MIGLCGLSQAKPFPASWPLHWPFPVPGMLCSHRSAHGAPSQSLGPSSCHHYTTLNNRCCHLQLLCAHLFRVCLPPLENMRMRILSTGCWLKSLHRLWCEQRPWKMGNPVAPIGCFVHYILSTPHKMMSIQIDWWNESVNEQWADAICLEYREPGEMLGHSPTRVSSLNPCGT